MTKSKPNRDRLRHLLLARLEGRAQPWVCATPIDLTVERDSRDHRRLVFAAYELLRRLGARRPPGARRQQTVRAGADAVREWLEFGTDPESTSDARTALFVARRPRQAVVERWERICAGLEQRPVALRLLTRARRKLALRRWELQRVCTTHALLHLVRAPICLRVHPFVEDVARCAAAAEVAGLLADATALRDLENLAWVRAAKMVHAPAAIEDAVRRAAPQILAEADRVLMEHAARAFEASAVVFIEWALGGDRRFARLARAHA